jgi:hypothetical protein
VAIDFPMLRSWRAISWRPLRRRLCAAVTLLAYLLATLGLPLPAPARKPDSVPFPCQDHPCGCVTAEQCWSACCCFTPEQRWAWARQHQVEPPAYAEKPSAHGWRTTRLRDRDGQGAEPSTGCRSCAQAPKSCCTSNPAPAPCCQKPQQGPNDKPSKPKPRRDAKPAPKGGAKWGLGVAALRCQGLNTLWAATGAALPAEPPLTWGPWNPAVAWLNWPAESPLALPSSPPEPPPRSPLA